MPTSLMEWKERPRENLRSFALLVPTLITTSPATGKRSQKNPRTWGRPSFRTSSDPLFQVFVLSIVWYRCVLSFQAASNIVVRERPGAWPRLCIHRCLGAISTLSSEQSERRRCELLVMLLYECFLMFRSRSAPVLGYPLSNMPTQSSQKVMPRPV